MSATEVVDQLPAPREPDEPRDPTAEPDLLPMVVCGVCAGPVRFGTSYVKDDKPGYYCATCFGTV